MHFYTQKSILFFNKKKFPHSSHLKLFFQLHKIHYKKRMHTLYSLIILKAPHSQRFFDNPCTLISYHAILIFFNKSEAMN